MQHNEFIKRIPDFLDDAMTDSDLEDFLDHLKQCKDCREELSIQFLIDKSFEKLETGGTINLKKDMKEYIQLEDRRLHERRRLAGAAYTLETLAVLAFIAAFAAIMTFLFMTAV